MQRVERRQLIETGVEDAQIVDPGQEGGGGAEAGEAGLNTDM